MSPQNWTRTTILFELRKIGLTAASIAADAGLSRHTVYSGLERPYPRVHTLVSNALGFPKEVIWPQFYTTGGKRRTVIRRMRSAA